MIKQRRIWAWFLVGLVTIAAQFLWVGNADAAVTDYLQEQKFLTNVWQIVNRSYVDEDFNHQNWYKVRRQFVNRKFNSREDTYQAIREMLATLDDPFTRLLEPDKFKSMQTSTSGELTGVGLQIAVDEPDNNVTVIAPIEGSPADVAGVRSRDRIVGIDNIPTTGLSLDECATRMRGAIGSEVKLNLERPLADGKGVEKLDVVIKRDRIAVTPIIAKLNQEENHKVGYVRLNQFNGNAVTDMEKTLRKLESDGADRYVLDLRGNPGGLFDAGLQIARMLIPEGTVVYTVDRHGVQESFEAKGSAITNDPLVVLTDSGTASASEILAGALQENQRAQLVGTKTYGKGLIQSLYELEDGAGLAVTIAKYETPLHHNIHKRGIIPDVEVALNEPITRKQLGTNEDPQYVAALSVLNGTYKNVIAKSK
ncbi:PDZ domain-containing protein [Pseudanabaena sp. FACHB-723]|uniref:PDZ domain-containing protein n=1 Tax=Pseudanabaena mucicola FACHB-723 TaxID=2692860 RepID=A0ABR8A0Z7_9CYAN|nr:S41 family peptidase [Pseudanabaena mucicola]MBD2189902.1 PDZ domain-containing protein [Pseudanabaena mucicola FACHB-723]